VVYGRKDLWKKAFQQKQIEEVMDAESAEQTKKHDLLRMK